MQQALEQARDGAAAHPRASWTRRCATPRADLSPHAPRIVTHPDQARSDPRRHRTRRQDHPRHRRGDRACKIDVEDDGTVLRRVGRRRRDAEGASTGSAASRRRPRSARSTRGTVDEGRRLRRLRRDPARAPTACCTSRSSRTSACSSVTDVLKEGDEIEVKVLEVDKSGKIRLSRKEALQRRRGAGEEARGS